MDKIYLKDNYIVTEIGGLTTVFPKNYSSYSENTTGFYLNSSFPVNNPRTVYIDFTRVTSIYDEAGLTAYSVSTLRSFFLTNTGFKSPSGGSGGVWGSITGTLSDQTDLQTALNAKQDTLISGTNIKTINGNTLLGSGDLTISTGITVGTTPVTSGTDGRVFFQSGGVVQQDAGFFWDNTNKRLGVGTATPSNAIHIQNQSGVQNGLRISNVTRTDYGNITIRNGTSSVAGEILFGSVGWSFVFRNEQTNVALLTIQDTTRVQINNPELLLNNRVVFFSDAVAIRRENNFLEYTGFAGHIFKSDATNNYPTATERMRITPTGNVGIGTNSPQARLDVRAQGALSTDMVQRWRNSANTADIGSIRGNGIWCIGLLASAPTGVEGAIYYDSTTKKHYGFDGTNWNALY